MVCVISVFKKGKLYKELSSKFFFIHHQNNYIEFCNTNCKSYMYFKDIEIEYENGICHIIVEMK